MYPELPDEGTQPVRQEAADAETHMMEKHVMTTRSIEMIFVTVLRFVMVTYPFIIEYKVSCVIRGVFISCVF